MLLYQINIINHYKNQKPFSTMSLNIQSSEQQTPLSEDFQNANAIIDSIAQPRDSQPTKLKVKNFKNRVFQLIKIYTTHSPNVNPLVQCLKQEMFLREPQKMKQLINDILNKANVTLQNLQQLLEYYKIILLYKLQKSQGDSIAVDFLKVLKKISSVDKNLVNETVLSMLKSFAFERKCHLNINFFFFLFRKYDGGAELRKLFIEKCQEFINDQKLRNAQKKQLTKLLARLDKTTKVKVKREEAPESEEEEDDDIKVVHKKKSTPMKVEKREDKVENDKIEEQGQPKKKQISVEQQQKLQRIKENKKKNRKQNPTQKMNKNEQNNSHKNGERKNHHQKEMNNKAQPQKSTEKKSESRQDGSQRKSSKNKFNKTFNKKKAAAMLQK